MAKQKNKSNNKKKNKLISIMIISVCILLALVIVLKIVDSNDSEKKHTQGKTAGKVSAKIKKPEILNNQFDIKIHSKYAAVLNSSKNEVIFSKNADLICRPASITKILTSIIVLENVKDLNKKITLSKKDSDFLDKTDLARVGFRVGEKVSVKDCLYCSILQSSADACLMMSRYVSGGDGAFSELMNEKVKELGLKNCHFDNSIGMDSNETYITVDEYVLIMKYALKNPKFRKIINTYQYTLKPTNKRKDKWTVTNGLLANIKDNYMIKSGKLGYTDLAELTLASYAKIHDDYYIIVTAYAKNKSGKGFRNIIDHERIYRKINKTLYY